MSELFDDLRKHFLELEEYERAHPDPNRRPCHCGDPLIGIYEGELDIRCHEGVHSLSRCSPRKPAGTRCFCGEVLGSQVPGIGTWIAIPWIKRKKRRLVGSREDWVHDVDECLPVREWVKR